VIAPADLKFYQSQGPNSSGGAVSVIQINVSQIIRLFPDVTRQNLAQGTTTYVKFFVTNTNPNQKLPGASIFALAPPADQEQIGFALGGPSDDTPSTLAFVPATGKANALALGDLGPGQTVAIWISRTTPANLEPFEQAMFQPVLYSAQVGFQSTLAFAWGLQPLPPEDFHMAQRIAYSLRLQRVTEEDVILSEDIVEERINIPNDISGGESYQIQPNTVDLPLPNIGNFQDLVFIRLSKISPAGCVVKFNTPTDTPFTIRPGGIILVDAQNLAQILVSNPSANQAAYFRVTRGVRQPTPIA